MTWRIIAIRSVFGANVVAWGGCGLVSLFMPDTAARHIFSGTVSASITMRLMGAFWLSIAVLSGIGIARTVRFSVILVIQLFYKTAWLAVVAFPAIIRGQEYMLPWSLTIFFLIWVIALPFIIPWRYLMQTR